MELITAVIIGRTNRYPIWGIFAVLYGNAVKTYMQKSLPELGAVLFAVFLFIIIGVMPLLYFRRPRVDRGEL